MPRWLAIPPLPSRVMLRQLVREAAGGEGRRAKGREFTCADGEVIDAPGFPVEVTNILGAGDAFGGGFIYGLVQAAGAGTRSARLGNACGAIVVTEHGCANFMPTLAEVEAFVAPYGGLD